MKYAAAMTLYNPTWENIENLKKTAELFEILYVYDNTEKKVPYAREISGIKQINYLWNGSNDGLPIAFNCMLELAEKDGVDYLCTLDQDSILTAENVQKIEDYIKNNDMANVAAIATCPTGTKIKSKEDIEKVEWVICSGCFLNLNALRGKKIKYDEAYFVDRFDADICMQMRRNRLQIIRLNKAVMEHRCGDENGGHSDLRHYYMFRNRLYYNYKYYSKPIAAVRTFLQDFRHAKWIYEDKNKKQQRKKVVAVAKSDYRNKLMGKISMRSQDIIS